MEAAGYGERLRVFGEDVGDGGFFGAGDSDEAGDEFPGSLTRLGSSR
jgi:hypothetical protein